MRHRIFASLALAMAAAVFVIAQSAGTAKPPDQTAKPPDQNQQPPVFRTEANFVRVDAYPTKDGRPVMDLKAEEFEVLEDGKPQSIQSFEHVVVSPAGPQAQRSEPNSIEASKQLAANPRNRVFVLFLDTPHVSVGGSWNAREPLVKLIDRILGPDDLVGVMTPKMAAADLVLARKTEVVASGLREIWPWGERFTLLKDERDRLYDMCYPMMSQDAQSGRTSSEVASEMMARRRERATLDALRELVQYLGGVREERKAIVTVSEGWLLYRPDQRLTSVRTDVVTGRQEPIPGPDPISVGPDGRITTKNRNVVGDVMSKNECDAERLRLSLIDDEQYFRDIVGEANRANATFYTVDPRGLPAFDYPIGPERPPSVIVDAVHLRNRIESLRTLADATDGIAVLNNNDLDAGLKRISDDLSSYYLLGYYSTNARLDGRFRTIKVRVKRPGVDVRARKGYRAATAAEVAAAKVAAAAPVPEARAAVTSAMSALARIRPESRFSMNAVPVMTGGAVATVWIAGELQSITGMDPWTRGGTVDLDVSAGGKSTTARVTLAAGERTFAVPVKLSTPIETGSFDVRAKLAGADPAAERYADAVHVDIGQGVGQPLVFRRGPATGNRVLPAATFLFSRTERVRLEFPVGADVKAAAGRLLDKGGQPLALPVTVGERTDNQTGQRWLTADITLAALGAGDYGIELTAAGPSGEQRVVAAIRVSR